MRKGSAFPLRDNLFQPQPHRREGVAFQGRGDNIGGPGPESPRLSAKQAAGAFRTCTWVANLDSIDLLMPPTLERTDYIGSTTQRSKG